MDDITYFSVNEFSKGITEFAEKCEYAKLLQANLATVDEKSIRSLEVEIAERKWAISEYLSNSSNYEEWKKFDNNNVEMLTKYVQKDYFKNEFEGTKLQEKITRDFTEQLKSNPDAAVTKREKLMIKHYEDNNVLVENRTFLSEHDAVVAGIHQKDKCFQRNFSRMLNDLPKKNSKEVSKVIDLVKANPLVLKDNPHHYVVNRGISNPSVSANGLKEILDDANIGDPSALAKLSKLQTSIEEMTKGTTNKNLVESYRKKFLGSDNTPSVKNTI